jgi:hypothetical protein
MEKTIATLTIKITDAVKNASGETRSSSMHPPQDGGIDWLITLRPNADNAIVADSWKEKDIAESILAHELGHFVARIFRDPTHNPVYRFLAREFDDNSMLLPAEKRAYELGRKIYPNLSQAAEKRALATYKEN